MPVELNYDGTPKQNHCECCTPKMINYTTTANPHKWTKREIEDEIIYLSRAVIESPWYDRTDRTRLLKHWLDKLARFEEAEENFDLSKVRKERI